MSDLSSHQRLGNLANRFFAIGAIVGGGGIILSIILAFVGDHGWDRFLRSYLFAFVVCVTTCLFALVFTMFQHATRAGWSVVVRRLSESIAANLQWAWVAFLPIGIAVAMHWTHLYHWADPGVADPDSANYDAILAHKAPFLNVGFWLLRAALYLGIWAVLARFFFRTSVAQDATGDVRLTHAMQKWAPLGILLFALTQTFAAFDWVMSLEAHWFSTMFGVYFFAAGACGFFSVLSILMWALQRGGKLRNEITKEHFQDVGKFLFAFGVVFWAYIGFSQFMLIWYANIPEETTWYMARTLDGWMWVSMLLLFGHFIIPFVLLITKHTKRATTILAGIAAWMFIMHIVDMYWLVMPVVPNQIIHDSAALSSIKAAVADGSVDVGFHPALIDLACLAGLIGLTVAMTAKRLGSVSLIPAQDPRLHESLAFENM